MYADRNFLQRVIAVT